jgi:hypothetical protein
MKKLSSKKWIAIGLFDKVNPEHYRGMTRLYNKALNLLNDNDIVVDGKNNEEVGIMIFPAILRIYLGVNRTDLNVKEILQQLRIHLNKNKTTIAELNIVGVDGEAEILANFTDQYIEQIK